jgi:hypothetical protein
MFHGQDGCALGPCSSPVPSAIALAASMFFYDNVDYQITLESHTSITWKQTMSLVNIQQLLKPFALLVIVSCAAVVQASTAGRVDLDTLRQPIYIVEGDAFVRHNGERFNNRPLYCNQIPAIVVAGDRPLARFGNGSVLNGTFFIALARGNKAKWLHDCSDITSKYRPGRMEWIIKDVDFGVTSVTLEVAPPTEGPGMVCHARIDGAQSGDKLIWACGGAMPLKNPMVYYWDVTTGGYEKKMAIGFSADDCRSNSVSLEGKLFTILSPTGKNRGITVGSCSNVDKITVADGGACSNPIVLAESTAKELPIVCGTIKLDDIREVYWAMQSFGGDKPGDTSPITTPADAFALGIARAENIGKRVTVDTPDARLNAAVGASSAVTDGVYRRGIYTHSGMRWGVPLLGWRSIYGGTAYGWHDRVKAEARYCLARQITESDKKLPVPDPKYGLSCQSLESRMFGKGRVNVYNGWHYDMQSLFFDQLIHSWRWTGDAELEKMLRPALELHLEYIHDCFDPDDDGVYESYANTWPTDNQWYNGGGTSEETAYAYTAHQAALELARRAGDIMGVKSHEACLEKIRRGFSTKMWSAASGHPGAYVEQIGLKRLHEDCWLYSIFCPIDAGLLSHEQAAQSLYYTEWALEREQMPYGGQRVWPSNWVPSLWSLREMWPGDNYQLALAYFQTGLTDDGWNVLRGTFPHLMFYGPVPGDLGHTAGGTDFNDCASTFARTVVEGLFGYRPNYPQGIVTIAPQFPSDWDHATIKTPDMALKFASQLGIVRYEIELAKSAALDVKLPLRAGQITKVTVNGQLAKWDLQPGFGQGVIRLNIGECQSAKIEVAFQQPLPQFVAEWMVGNAGNQISLRAKDAEIVEFLDSQGVLSNAAVKDGAIVGEFTHNAGERLVLAKAKVGQTLQWRQFKIKLVDPEADVAKNAKLLQEVPRNARWSCMDITKHFNGDICGIFKQQYLTPRPLTCSLRLATDGYSTWQMSLDAKNRPPSIELTNAPKLLNDTGRIVTSQGVPFAWLGKERNIAFTSQWDNWPRSISVPVNSKGDAVWLLVCGSTNPMQGRIANAILRFKYTDGLEEKLELEPPLNFWSLCRFEKCDYDYKRDSFALPKEPPKQVQLGENCRAMVYGWNLRPGEQLETVTLETLSQEVVIGLMGVSVMNPN